eukprot:4356824-Amphidinium_carterae.2
MYKKWKDGQKKGLPFKGVREPREIAFTCRSGSTFSGGRVPVFSWLTARLHCYTPPPGGPNGIIGGAPGGSMPTCEMLEVETH